MNSSNSRSINETSRHILIPQKSPTNKKEQLRLNEYSLKQNFFDPSKNTTAYHLAYTAFISY